MFDIEEQPDEWPEESKDDPEHTSQQQEDNEAEAAENLVASDLSAYKDPVAILAVASS